MFEAFIWKEFQAFSRRSNLISRFNMFAIIALFVSSQVSEDELRQKLKEEMQRSLKEEIDQKRQELQRQ